MIRRIAISLALALLSTGCTMKAYEGPELPKSDIAVLDILHRHGDIDFPLLEKRHHAKIVEIDGKKRNTEIKIHILPGQHTARVSYWRYPNTTLCIGIGGSACFVNYETDLSIDFTAKAGHEYRIPAERRGERNWIWVEDVTSGKVVAGEKPPQVKTKGKKPTETPK